MKNFDIRYIYEIIATILINEVDFLMLELNLKPINTPIDTRQTLTIAKSKIVKFLIMFRL